MITDFIIAKLKIAKYKILKDGIYFGMIPGISGVWANAKTLEGCRKELQEVLEDWLVLQLRDRQEITGLKTKPLKIKSKQYA